MSTTEGSNRRKKIIIIMSASAVGGTSITATFFGDIAANTIGDLLSVGMQKAWHQLPLISKKYSIVDLILVALCMLAMIGLFAFFSKVHRGTIRIPREAVKPTAILLIAGLISFTAITIMVLAKSGDTALVEQPLPTATLLSMATPAPLILMPCLYIASEWPCLDTVQDTNHAITYLRWLTVTMGLAPQLMLMRSARRIEKN